MGRFRRHWLTGELEEVPYELEHGRAIIARIEPENGVTGHADGAYSSAKPFTSTSLGIHPSQVKAFNEEARKQGTGAYYRPDGTMVCETRRSRNRELARRGYGDADAGYGDRPPGG